MLKTIKDEISSNSYKAYPLKIEENNMYYFPYKYQIYCNNHLYLFFTKTIPPSFNIQINNIQEISNYQLIVPNNLITNGLDYKQYIDMSSDNLYLVLLNTNSISSNFFSIFYYISYRL